MAPKTPRANKLHVTSKPFDVAFIGSGIASSFTLINLLRGLLEQPVDTTLEIAVIEKYPEFFSGIPYGERSGNTALLITSLEDFLPEPELSKFIDWLNVRKEELLDRFIKEGGNLSQQWMDNHKGEIAENSWKKIFVPRRFFGIYISEKVSETIREVEAAGLANIHLIQEEISDIERKQDFYHLVGNTHALNAKRIVLGIGSPPTKPIWDNSEFDGSGESLLIPELYQPGLNDRIEQVKEFVENSGRSDLKVLIIGANASALEILYKLNDVEAIGSNVDKFYFLSSLGLIPDSRKDSEALGAFSPKHTLGLAGRTSLTASEIAEAVYKDLDIAEENDIRAATTLGPVSKAFGDLLGLLGPEELREFACKHGNEIGRRQRCAGAHYAGVSEALRKDGRFEHLAGRYLELVPAQTGGVHLKFREKGSAEERVHPDKLDIVINCIGGSTLNSGNITALYENLIAKQFCQPNDSMRGFQVNENFEASEDFFVTGPLLAGNVIEGRPLWHLEHCGRIIWSSQLLGALLCRKLSEKSIYSP